MRQFLFGALAATCLYAAFSLGMHGLKVIKRMNANIAINREEIKKNQEILSIFLEILKATEGAEESGIDI